METGHALSLQPFIPEWGNGITEKGYPFCPLFIINS
jgi:hypothetical protein